VEGERKSALSSAVLPVMTVPSRPAVRPTRVKIPQHVVFRAFAEESVVLNLESGRYHGLNPTAGRMLELIGELGDLDVVAERIADETGTPATRVANDLRQLCSSLEERGLIEVEPRT
jgi:Coenzyme PQQ synthesis protein D (PqqD)